MKFTNLLIISNNFPDKNNTYVGDIFVKEQVKYLKNYFKNVYVISPLAYGIEYLRKFHFENYTFDNVHVYFPRYLNFPYFYFHFQDFWVYNEYFCICNLIKRNNLQFDLIHAHFTWPSGAVAVKLKKKFQVPVIITEHTHETLYNELKKENKLYIKSWKQCDAIIRVNKKDIPLIVNRGRVPIQKVFHIENGFDPLKFKFVQKDNARRKLGLKNDLKIIFNFGRLSEEKGQKYLIDAVNKVIKTKKNILCIIGGRGPLKNKLQNQINELKLQNHIMLIGFIPDELLTYWIHACDIFVLPSLGEGNPTVMFECLGCGRPFIGTKVGGVTEVIVSDNYGLIVDPGNTESLVQAIEASLDTEWNSQLIEQYAEQFTWENIAKKILSVYYNESAEGHEYPIL